MTSTTTARDIDVRVELSAPPDAVWRALTEPSELVRWLAPDARVTPGPGGRLWLSWGDGMGVEEPIEAWEPPSRLRYPFGVDRATKAPLEVEWRIDPRGAGASLRLVHSGFSAAGGDELYESHARGWRVFLRNLRHAIERHPGEPCAHRAFAVHTRQSRDEVWAHVVALDRHGKSETRPEGAHYHLALGDGHVVEGTVEVFARARDLALTIGDDTLLRVSLERAGEGTLLYAAVLAYGRAAEGAERLARELEAALRAAM